MLTAIETTATIGNNRQLLLDEDLPENTSKRVRVIVLIDEDIYTLKDGKPLQKSRKEFSP